MIWRFGSAVLLLYSLGFILFAFTLGKPADSSAAATDAGIVLTGGDGRIERGVEVLRQGKIKRLLVAGRPASPTGNLPGSLAVDGWHDGPLHPSRVRQAAAQTVARLAVLF